MKRPLAAVVVAYVIGLLTAQVWHPPLPPRALDLSCAAAGALILALAVVSLLRAPANPADRRRYRLCAYPLVAVLGWANFSARIAVRSPADLRQVLGDASPAACAVRGAFAETPRLKITERRGRELWHSVVIVHVREIKRANDFEPATGDLLATAPQVLDDRYFAGQTVEISGVIQRPPPPLAEGLFDFRSYLATRGIYYQLKTESTNDWQLRGPLVARPPLTVRFLNWSQQTLALGLPVQDEPLRLLWAMTLGWRTAFTGDIGDPFLQAGTMHMFAIDGLRIALLSGMIVTLLRVLRLSRAWCGLIAVPVIWFYTAATGWESSAIRASVMMTIVLGGWALKRPGDLLNSLAAAALVILLIDPRQILEAGFQLSFFVMLAIGIMLTPLNAVSDAVLARWLQPDPLLPEALVPAWRKTLLLYSQRFAHFCSVSFAAWVGSLPLAAKYFHLFSPVSTLANIFAIPLGALALTANLGALICGHWLPWFTILFNHAAWFLMVAMTWVSVASARLPGAYCYVAEPSLAAIVLYYAVLLALFSGWFATARRKWLGALLLALIAAAGIWQWQSSRAQVTLTVLPLDGGHTVYVDAVGRRNEWLINCGSAQAAEYPLKDYLHAQGVNTLPRLALAAANARNCGGAALVRRDFDVRELWTSDVNFRSSAYRDALKGSQNPHAVPSSGSSEPLHCLFKYGETNGCWRVLYPLAARTTPRADDAPLVLLGTFHDTRVLLLSELSRAAQSALLGQQGSSDLKADIVVAGLPDEGEPLCDDLLRVIQPAAIVIADSDYPATRRASQSLHERLDHGKIPVVYTRTAGAVKLFITPRGWWLRTMDGRTLPGPSAK